MTWAAGRVAMVLALIALLVGPAAAFADGTPIVHRAPGDSTDDPAQFVRVSIDSVAPNTVTLTSDPVVVVTATVANVGDRTVRDLTARLQRAPAVTTSIGLRTALRLDSKEYDTGGEFVTVADRLGTGQRKQFTLTMPLRATPGQSARSLDITKPGVFPLLVNVNGTPDFDSSGRLDYAPFLLPVLGVPPNPSATTPDNPTTADNPAGQDDPGAAVPPTPAAPVATTVLWPLADRPRLAGGNTGATDRPARLLDDVLASELAKGGRLDQLVSALEFAIGPTVDRDRKLADSVCLAVDPDLLVTVDAMTRGYQVPDRPDDPYGPAHSGTGTASAGTWLDRVRALAGRVCTVAVPFAQADLPAVRAVDSPELTAAALVDPAGTVDTLLQTTSLRGVTWPASGSLDDETATLLRRTGTGTVLLAGSAVAGGDSAVPPPDIVRFPAVTDGPALAAAPGAPAPDPALHGATFDVSTASALAAAGASPFLPSFTAETARFQVGRDSRGARLQNALGTLAWSAVTPLPGYPRSLLVAPPQEWSIDGDEAGAVLAQLATLLRSGLAAPRKLTDLIGQPPAADPFEPAYLQQAVNDSTPESLQPGVRVESARIDTLLTALVEDPQRELTPRRFVAPLRADLLRALSLSGRQPADSDEPDRAGLEAVADGRLSRSTAAVESLFGEVTVIAPGGSYTLASEQSPLLLVARNDLPVGIRVRVRIDAPDAMSVADIGEQLLPPSGSRTLQLPAKVAATKNLVVHVGLTTPAGQPLGDPTALSVRSNAYGKALAMITASAGALLLLLSGRRLWHRFRGQPDRADEGYSHGRHSRAPRRHRAPAHRSTRTSARRGTTMPARRRNDTSARRRTNRRGSR